jgi:hypothetical protein
LLDKLGINIKRRFQKKTKILTENNPFECLVLFTRIPDDAKVILKSKGKKISSVAEGQWVGVPEMLQVQQNFEKYAKEKIKVSKEGNVDDALSELRKTYRENINYLEITVQIVKVGLDPIEYLEFDYIINYNFLDLDFKNWQ